MMIGLAALDPNNPAANITTDPNSNWALRLECDLAPYLWPSYCDIPSVNDTAAYVNAEMAGTSLTPANQTAATAAGNTAIAADQQLNPAGYLAQCAASNYPNLSAMFSPALIASAVGCQPDGTTNLLGSWGIYLLLAIGVTGFMVVSELSRR